MAAASTFTRTSPGPGSGTGTFRTSTTSGPPKSSKIAARIIFGIETPRSGPQVGTEVYTVVGYTNNTALGSSPGTVILACDSLKPTDMSEAQSDSEAPTEELPTEVDDDTTLGGYFRVHDRPPAYDGSDGHPYSVSVEVERTANLRAPFAGYLVFPRWAQNGVGIVGHVESETLAEGPSSEDVTEALGEKTLMEVQHLLEEAITRAAANRTDG